MSDATLRLAPARDDTSAPARRQTSATLNHLASPGPLEEWERPGVEIAEDVERLKAKIATRATLEIHLRISGAIA